MVLTNQQAVEEARLQKKALATLGKWRSMLFLLTACFVVLAIFALRTGGSWFVPGIAGAILAGISLLLMLTVNLSIRNGNRNVERILASLKKTGAADPAGTAEKASDLH